MIKAVIFDADGMIVHGIRFSSRLAKKYNISTEVTGSFFKNEFQNCLIGKADLKKELEKQIPIWGWKGNVESLLSFWFSEEYNLIDERFKPIINDLRGRGIKCYLATNNEKYRTENMVKTRGLGEWFDGVFSSGEAGSKKPEKDFFEYIMSNLPNVSKEEIIFWDDDQENIDGAEAYGIQTETYRDFYYFEQKVKDLVV